MVECPMPQDILKYKSKFIANFTVREITCATLGAGLGLLSYFNINASLENKDLSTALAVLIALPFLLVGFVKLYEQPFEKIVPTLLMDNFISPPKKKKEIHYPEFEKYEKTRYWLKEEITKEDESDILGKKKKKNSSSKPKIKIEKSSVYRGIK